MNKPDWKDAPEWANYLAMDGNGFWYWYEKIPAKNQCESWHVPFGRIKQAPVLYCEWANSLEARPE